TLYDKTPTMLLYSLFITSPHTPLPPLFFFTATAPTVIYTLSLHDALPICFDGETIECAYHAWRFDREGTCVDVPSMTAEQKIDRSEEHTSEPQSRENLVCRLLLEKKKKKKKKIKKKKKSNRQ